MKKCCFYKYYIKQKLKVNPMPRPLTHESETGYEYIEVNNMFCPMCGERVGQVKQKTASL